MVSFTSTVTESTTFSLANARHISARIATDLSRLTSFYPTKLTELRISQFQEEATLYLKAGYLKSVTYGFRKEESNWMGDTSYEWVLALKYVANEGEFEGGSSIPGGIKPGTDVSGTHFYSYLVLNSKFFELDQTAQDAFENTLPINRSNGKEPVGTWRQDLVYGQGGRYMNRFTCGN